MFNRHPKKDLDQSRILLDKLFTAAVNEESSLDGGTKLGTGGNALKSLRETRVGFGNPKDSLVKLTPDLFQQLGINTITEIQRLQMKDKYDFYFLTMPIILKPGHGAQFSRLDCELDFKPKGALEPIIQSIFPRTEWRDVLNWGGAMNLALNSNLDWELGVDMNQLPKTLYESLSSQISAKVINKNNLKAFIAIPDFSFNLGRVEIVATGEGSSQAYWSINKPELRQIQQLKFGIVFKVLKGVESITLTGKVFAEPSFTWLVANLRDVFENLSNELKGFLQIRGSERKGYEKLPIGDYERWMISLT